MINGKYKEKALEILKRADIGIADFSVIKDKVANEKELKPRFTYEGTMVLIDGFEAESGKTVIDFKKP